MTDADRRFVNNPFARALHPDRGHRSWVARVALVLVSIFGATIMAAAFVLPMLFAHGLIVGGWRAGRWGMVAAGLLVVAVYGAALVGGVRGWLNRRRRSS